MLSACLVPVSKAKYRRYISNKSSFRLEHPRLLGGSDGSGGTTYLWRRMSSFPSPRRRIALHTYLHYFAPGIPSIRTTRGLHSSQRLQLYCRHLHNAWRHLFLSSADSHILPFRYSYVSDAGLAQYLFRFEIFLPIHCLPLHSIRIYCISQV